MPFERYCGNIQFVFCVSGAICSANKSAHFIRPPLIAIGRAHPFSSGQAGPDPAYTNDTAGGFEFCGLLDNNYAKDSPRVAQRTRVEEKSLTTEFHSCSGWRWTAGGGGGAATAEPKRGKPGRQSPLDHSSELWDRDNGADTQREGPAARQWQGSSERVNAAVVGGTGKVSNQIGVQECVKKACTLQ